MFLICGLGNPGVEYYNTRHNIGFKLADKIISHFNLDNIKKNKSQELYSGEIEKIKIFVLKPLTFMNLSGKKVLETMNFYKINVKNIFVIHDDLDLQLGKVKIKKGGGNGGHNGLASIDKYIGEEYNRIRIGINHPGHKNLVSNYVLNNFNKEEEEILDKKLEKIKDNFNLVFYDIPLLLNELNKK